MAWSRLFNHRRTTISDVAQSYNFILGRQIESLKHATGRLGQSVHSILAELLASDEFRINILDNLAQGRPLPAGFRSGTLGVEFVNWVTTNCPLTEKSMAAVSDCNSWNALHSIVFADPNFQAAMSRHKSFPADFWFKLCNGSRQDAYRSSPEMQEIIGKQVATLLDRFSALKALAFQLERQSRQVQSLAASIDTNNSSIEQAKGALLAHDSLISALDGRLGMLDASRIRDGKQLEYVTNRIEFVRREVLFEMLHGSKNAATIEPTVGKIVNAEKMQSQTADGIRINLGCGHIPLEQYLNVDGRELPGVDVVADVSELPFVPDSIAEIFSSHLLEHFPVEKLARTLLPYWFNLLRPGGQFRAIIPDGGAMIKAVASGETSFRDFREVLFGAQDYQGDFHYNMFDTTTVVDLLEKAGFVNVRIVAEARRNGLCHEMEVSATRPLR